MFDCEITALDVAGALQALPDSVDQSIIDLVASKETNQCQGLLLRLREPGQAAHHSRPRQPRPRAHSFPVRLESGREFMDRGVSDHARERAAFGRAVRPIAMAVAPGRECRPVMKENPRGAAATIAIRINGPSVTAPVRRLQTRALTETQ